MHLARTRARLYFQDHCTISGKKNACSVRQSSWEQCKSFRNKYTRLHWRKLLRRLSFRILARNWPRCVNNNSDTIIANSPTKFPKVQLELYCQNLGKLALISDRRKGSRNSNCSEGQMMQQAEDRIWRWRNNGGTWTLLETAFKYYFSRIVSWVRPVETKILPPYKFLLPRQNLKPGYGSVMSYRQIISSRLYVRLKGTCSLASWALLNNGE